MEDLVLGDSVWPVDIENDLAILLLPRHHHHPSLPLTPQTNYGRLLWRIDPTVRDPPFTSGVSPLSLRLAFATRLLCKRHVIVC